METLKLGMVGAGFVARFQAKAMTQVRGMELSGVVAPEGAPELQAFAKQNGLGPCTIYKSVTEMAKNVEAIAIYCPNFVRLAVMEEIAAAIKAGAPLKGVICEKPLARNVAEGKKMVDLAAGAKLRTAYFENQIHMKPIKAALAQLAPQQRTMGPLALTRSAEEHGGPHMGWFWDPTRQGGGVLCDMGCHSIAVGWYVLIPLGKPITFLQPTAVNAEIALLKWGLPKWRAKLLKNRGVDYSKTPGEDFATGMITFKNPETGQIVKAQFTDSWMFEKQGLRLFMDGMGPGYAFEVNTLVSPLTIFIGDVAAEAVADQESALEKATASRGLLAVQHNEADLYGYTDENEDARAAFLAGRDGYLPLSYGLEITKLVTAAYMSADLKKTIDLTDPRVQKELETYIPMVQQGRGAEVLHVGK